MFDIGKLDPKYEFEPIPLDSLNSQVSNWAWYIQSDLAQSLYIEYMKNHALKLKMNIKGEYISKNKHQITFFFFFLMKTESRNDEK